MTETDTMSPFMHTEIYNRIQFYMNSTMSTIMIEAKVKMINFPVTSVIPVLKASRILL